MKHDSRLRPAKPGNKSRNTGNKYLGDPGYTNYFAAALVQVCPRWDDVLERVPLKTGTEIIFEGMRPSTIYFPFGGMVSMLVDPMQVGAAAGSITGAYDPKPAFGKEGKIPIQVTMLGDEDCVGLQGLLGNGISTYRAVVDMGSPGLKCSAIGARALLASDEPSRNLVARYLDMQLAEAWQTAASAVQLKVDERVAMWLLRLSMLLGSDALPVPHKMMADRLGGRRASVSEACQKMVADGWIEQERGRINILDENALLKAAERYWPTMRSHRQTFTDLLLEVLGE